MAKSWSLLLALAALGCAPALRQPSAADAAWAGARWPGVTLEELQRGRRVYVTSCGGCHGLHLPSELTPERWEKVLEEMADEGKLSGGDRDIVLRFILALAANPAPPTP